LGQYFRAVFMRAFTWRERGSGLPSPFAGKISVPVAYIGVTVEAMAVVHRRRPTEHVGACSLRGLRALFAGIQKVEIASGEILLLLQVLGHAGAHERSGRDPSEHVVVPREQLAQLRADVRLRELRRHLPESTTRRAPNDLLGLASRRSD
jgi:hypothetical protein